MARKQFKPHPNRISSVLFYLASIIIHDIFHTNHDDFSISDTSSYLDLAPLYGSCKEDQQAIRTLRDGRLKPDCFSDSRILGFPPGVGTMLIFFNRFHNHVAENLALIDEGGRFSRIFSPPGKLKPADAEELYDEALFQTARLITCGLYVNIILKDYVRTILNLNRADTVWSLDPRTEAGSAVFGHKIPEATGNSVSAEFNLVYRWHSVISERDEQWTKETYEKLVGTDPLLSMGQFLRALNEWAQTLSPDPVKRDFAGLERLPDGRLRDEDLASIWTDSVSDVAGSYGARHVPEILKNVEILGIIQSRSWNLASLNEFRAFFKLESHKTFEDINPDPVIAEQLRRLYGHPDNVEIYPGIAVEAAKEPKTPGSGLCTNFTISRAVLSDAVALVRGDRFYTTDYTPRNLTNWGFNEVDYDLDVDYGCVLYKLVLTALPQSYDQNSIYVHYPLVIPEENKIILAKLGKDSIYTFAPPTDISSEDMVAPNAVTQVSASPLLREAPELQLGLNLYESDDLAEVAAAFYKTVIPKLLQSNSYDLAGRQYVDIQRVFNIAHAQFVSDLFPLPTMEDTELIGLMTTLHGSTNAQQPAKRFTYTNLKVRQHFLGRVKQEAGRLIKGGTSDSMSPLRRHGLQAMQTLVKRGLSSEEIFSTHVVPLAAAIFVSQSRAFAEALDLALGPGLGQTVQNDGVDLSKITGPGSDQNKLNGTLNGELDDKPDSQLAGVTASAALQVVCDLEKLGRAVGPMGTIRRLKKDGTTNYLNVEESAVSTFPVSMTIQWEVK